MSQVLRFAGYGAMGAAITALILLAPEAVDPPNSGRHASFVVDWALRNLGWSLPLFAVVSFAWLCTLGALARALEDNDARVDHLDHLADTWAQLSFGIGVIWTAIGMRNALVYSVDGAGGLTTNGADKLALMIDGGILLALSTTIVGGLLGYLMRVVKTLKYGTALRDHARRASNAPLEVIVERLAAIEASLSATRPASHSVDTPTVPQ